VATLITRSLL